MFEKILVPVDLSERAAEAVRIAMHLAAVHRSSVTLLHVIETLDAQDDGLRDFYNDLERNSHAHLDRLAEPLRSKGIATESLVSYGKRARQIIEFAEGTDFDLVVIGSHRLSRENFTSGFMTISHQVAIVCRIPVLVVKS